jgi:RND superfamily putative drug exporter
MPAGTEEAVFDPLVAELAADPGVATVTPVIVLPSGDTALITVYAASSPQDEATTDLLNRIRDDIVPATTAGTPVTVYVGGSTAIFADFGQVLTSKLPLFFGVVVLISCLLLMMVFRSILVPIKAAVMNLLSIGAAFGIIVAVFQWGWGADLLGIKPGPIESFLPVMLFAILFGLSMDYEVFLVSRIHEEWIKTRDNTLAVTRGLASTGRVITAAALIMFVVFGSFVLGGERVIQLFGIGLAAAVLVDATVIRSLLVPSLMQLFGRANWWLPGWLDRILPNLSVEGGPTATEQPAPPDLVDA